MSYIEKRAKKLPDGILKEPFWKINDGSKLTEYDNIDFPKTPSTPLPTNRVFDFDRVMNFEIDIVTDENSLEGKEGTASLFSCIFNLTNAMVGSGVLSLPYGYYSSGLTFGIVVMLVHAFLSSLMSLSVFLSCKFIEERDSKKVRSFPELAAAMFGERVRTFVEILQVLEIGSCHVIAVIIIGDCATPFVDFFFCGSTTSKYFFCERKFVLSFVSITCLFPLLMTRNMDTFRYFSFLSILSTAYVVCMVVTTSLVNLITTPFGKFNSGEIFMNTSLYDGIIPQILAYFPMICFAYSCQHIIPGIYYEMKKPTTPRILCVVYSQLSIATILYLGVSIFGFLHFRNHMEGDILVSFHMGNVPAMIARFAYLLSVILTEPLWFGVLRRSIANVFFSSRFFCCYCSPTSTFSFLIVTIGTFAVILLLASLVPGIDTAIGFTCSFFTVTVIIACPSCMMCKVLWERRKNKGGCFKYSWYLMFCVPPFFIVLAIFIIVVGTVFTTIKTVNENIK